MACRGSGVRVPSAPPGGTAGHATWKQGLTSGYLFLAREMRSVLTEGPAVPSHQKVTRNSRGLPRSRRFSAWPHTVTSQHAHHFVLMQTVPLIKSVRDDADTLEPSLSLKELAVLFGVSAEALNDLRSQGAGRLVPGRSAAALPPGPRSRPGSGGWRPRTSTVTHTRRLDDRPPADSGRHLRSRSMFAVRSAAVTWPGRGTATPMAGCLRSRQPREAARELKARRTRRAG